MNLDNLNKISLKITLLNSLVYRIYKNRYFSFLFLIKDLIKAQVY